ncbi:FAD-binding oxidoreductase [Trinickia terrae]|uniref:FAD-binding oxidoreductase n=1 Tax=Trinickia terrae TaxID=2571161 RepID=A0A4U1I9W3_9BURK|nr:FAD-binding oxidoreductase [Trinickia terrae]TKC90304.1 FAD-binding oxidoreductase [Trinickia terrae]
MNVDVVVVGGGIAGAACAYFLAQRGSVALLEGEDAFGYHATGRSAALFSEYFGSRPVRLLTAASRAFFEAPPGGFADAPLLSPRGVVALATESDVQTGRFDAALAAGRDARIAAFEITLDDARAMCPILAPHGYARALARPAVADIDVDALHQGFLRGVRARGGSTMRGEAVTAIRREAGVWHVVTAGGHAFATGRLVNAAGAWADDVAALAGAAPIGLMPKRRTAVLVDAAGDAHWRAALPTWPMVTNVADTFYFKPESGKLMVSPSDETPAPPCDAQPEELDVAIAVARLEAVTTLRVARVTHKWAGLRSVVADELPVLGEAPDAPGFFWAAALGGFGIQTAPAVGRAVAALVAGGALPDDVDETALSPAHVTKYASHDDDQGGI